MNLAPYWFVPDWVFHSTRRYRRFEQTRGAFEVRLHQAGSAAATGETQDAEDRDVQRAPTAPWKLEASALLKEVDARLKGHDLDGAWHNLHEAMRKEIPTLRGQELANREQILRCEVEKVQSRWRKMAIDKLTTGENDEGKRAQRLEAAQALLDDYYQNQYLKNSLLLGHMRNLFFISLIALATLLALLASNGPNPENWPEWDWKTLLAVLLFGVLGASFSATRKVKGDSGGSKIPEMAAGFSITIARTALGATPALAAYAFLKSGILTVGGGNTTSMPVALGIAFAAGFSERLVLRVLESLDGKTEDKPDNKGGRKTEGAHPA